MCVVVRQMHECVRCAWLAVRKTRCWNGSDHLKTFVVLHVNSHILQDLIIQCVGAVKLTATDHTHMHVTGSEQARLTCPYRPHTHAPHWHLAGTPHLPIQTTHTCTSLAPSRHASPAHTQHTHAPHWHLAGMPHLSIQTTHMHLTGT